MSQFVTTKSTNIITGDTVNLLITLSKEGGVSFVLKEDSEIIVSNVFDVLNESDKLKNVKYKDSSIAYFSDLNFDDDNNTYYYSVENKEISSFQIKITGKLKSEFSEEATIQVKFTEDNQDEQTINFLVTKQDTPIGISKFCSNQNIIQKGKSGDLTLSYGVTGSPDELILYENGIKKEALKNKSSGNTIISFPELASFGLKEYTLQATKGKQMFSQSLTVLYVDKSCINTRDAKKGYTITNFCVAQDENYLFALVSDKNENLEIHYTNQYGGENSWETILLSDDDTEIIRPFKTSPMIHLQSPEEMNNGALGRLLFIGGSRAGKLDETSETANKVATITLSNKVENIVGISEKMTWKPRWGHTCILFPKALNKNTIWMMGGGDKNGNATNEIWTSTDGNTWSKETNGDWSERVMHAACVSYKIENNVRTKNAIFLGGGFESFGENSKNDIWKWDGKSWTNTNLELDKNMSFGIGYGAGEENGDIGLYVMGINIDSKNAQSKYFKKINKNNKNKYNLIDDSITNDIVIDSYNQGYLTTAFFKECLFFLSAYDTGSKEMTFSKLYYRIPTIQQTTIKL